MNTLTLGTYLKGTQWERPITLKPADWADHIYCAGKTGMGKSTLIKHLTKQLPAFLLIDGEGDLAEAVANSRPCIYIRAADFDFPVGINPLVNAPPDQRSRLTAEAVAYLSDLFELDPVHTPKLLHWLRATVRALLDVPGSTLLDIAPMLTDKDYRSLKLERVKDPWAKRVWRSFDLKQLRDQEAQTDSLLNKAEALASYLPMQLTIGQATSSVDFRWAMDTGMPIVCNLSGIGDEPMKFLGATIFFAAQQAAAQRFDDAVTSGTVDQLTAYPAIIDEFEDFASRTMPRVLSKFRKRFFPLLLFHQYIEQLDPKIAAAIFANCGTLMSFRVGVNDAPIIAEALGTEPDNIKDLSRGRAWVAYQQDGVRAEAVPIDIPIPKLRTGFLQSNIKTTQHRYAIPRAEAVHRRSLEEWKTWKRRNERLAREAVAAEAKELEKEERKRKRKQREEEWA